MNTPLTLTRRPQPAPALEGLTPYTPTPRDPAIDLDLSGNEGPPLARAGMLSQVPAEIVRRYPRSGPLEAELAARWGLPAAGCWVGAGADEALDRLCRAYLAPGRELLVATPTFAMLPRYARLAGAAIREVPWPGGDFPREALLAAVSERTALVAVVSPNNPTGAVASADDLRALAAAAPGAVLLLDAAYTEFADEDLTPVALALPNAVVARTFSKAYGLAGLRVGYLLGDPALLAPLRVLSPYPAAGPSLWLAARAAQAGPDTAALSQVRAEREALQALARRAGLQPEPSQGNFVLVRGVEPAVLSASLREDGIAVRAFADEELADAVRITCPGDPVGFTRLQRALARAWGLPVDEAVAACAVRARQGRVERVTAETAVTVSLALDGEGWAEVDTGLGFLDHMLTALARHGGLDLVARCRGDLQVDDHHTVEDVALALGEALDQALGDRRGIQRFGEARIPMDEALASAAVDLSNRPFARVELSLRREALGGVACENLTHFFRSFASAARLCLHLEVERGENDHHKAEAAFKALARALRAAVSATGEATVPSTKGVL